MPDSLIQLDGSQEQFPKNLRRPEPKSSMKSGEKRGAAETRQGTRPGSAPASPCCVPRPSLHIGLLTCWAEMVSQARSLQWWERERSRQTGRQIDPDLATYILQHKHLNRATITLDPNWVTGWQQSPQRINHKFDALMRSTVTEDPPSARDCW